MSRPFRNTALALCVSFALSALVGCGLFTVRPTEFPSPETGDDGETFLLDDLRAIAADPDLTEEQKRQAMRDLGVQDEELIDALLTL